MNTFQDQEYEKETGWVKFRWRNHDPAIGRFFNVDPLAEKYLYNSPYAFSENHVVRHVELEGLEKTDFSNKDVNKMKSYFQQNAELRNSQQSYDDCITCHNKGMRTLLNNNDVPVGSQADITRSKMQDAGFAGETQTIGFKQADGSKAITPGQVSSMDGSVGKTAKSLAGGNSNSVFGVSLIDGFHTMTLTVSTEVVNDTAEGDPNMSTTVTTYTLSDQGTGATSNKGNLTFSSTKALDSHLTSYVAMFSNLDFPAKIEIHQIQQPENEEE